MRDASTPVPYRLSASWRESLIGPAEFSCCSLRRMPFGDPLLPGTGATAQTRLEIRVLANGPAWGRASPNRVRRRSCRTGQCQGAYRRGVDQGTAHGLPWGRASPGRLRRRSCRTGQHQDAHRRGADQGTAHGLPRGRASPNRFRRRSSRTGQRQGGFMRGAGSCSSSRDSRDSRDSRET